VNDDYGVIIFNHQSNFLCVLNCLKEGVMKKLMPILLFLFITLVCCDIVVAQNDVEIFSTRNKGGVQNGPPLYAIFTISQPMLITRINTYHWNNGNGTKRPEELASKELVTGRQKASREWVMRLMLNGGFTPIRP
jgi:hypothetical protein